MKRISQQTRHSPVELDKLSEFVEKMPAFPNSVQRVIQLTSDINSSGKAIVEVIESDPIMTVKILKMINSPYYGLPKKINSIQRAVVYIGMNTIKNMALSVAAIGVLKGKNQDDFQARDFLLHSLTTAAISKRLAEMFAVRQVECSNYFVAGLLHDFGKIVLSEFKAEEYKQALQKSAREQIPLYHCEAESVGIDHSLVGAMLAEKWAFDQCLVEAIKYHHTPKPDDLMTICLFAADQISKKLCFGSAGDPVVEIFPPLVSDRFDMDLLDLIESLGDLSPLRADALTFIL